MTIIKYEKTLTWTIVSTVRKIIEEHFGDRIVYDKIGGGTYIEAAINAWCIDDDDWLKM